MGYICNANKKYQAITRIIRIENRLWAKYVNEYVLALHKSM